MNEKPSQELNISPGIIFMGTPEFAAPSLKALFEHGHDIRAVVTQPDRPRGRGKRLLPSAVKQVALDLGLEVLQPQRASSPEFCKDLAARAPDILVVVAFGQILRRNLLDIPRWGALNIHASLLPKYRGAAPIQWAVLNHEDKTGLTAMKMDEGLDTGPILLQEETPILEDETTGRLQDRLAQMSGPFLIRTLKALCDNQLREIHQDNAAATHASKIDRGMAKINWGQSAQAISALIRAMDPWPGAATQLGETNLKVYSPRVIEENHAGGVPGRFVGCSEGGLEIETGKGILQIREVQAPGKKRLPSSEFLRGFPLKKYTILE